MNSFNGFIMKYLFVLSILLFVYISAHAQNLEDLMRQADSTRNAILNQFENHTLYEEENLPDISFEPGKLLWQTVHLPYVQFKIPRQSKYNLDFRYLAMITFNSGMGDAPTSALCDIGVMSKKELEDEFWPLLRTRCDPCDTQQLPAEWHAELADRGGKYIEHIEPRDYMSMTAFGDINKDSVFVLSVMSRTSDNFKKTTPEIFKYVLSHVKILDDYGIYGEKLYLGYSTESQVVPFVDQFNFDERSETYMVKGQRGDVYVAGVVNNSTYIRNYSEGDFTKQTRMVKVLEDSRVRDLIATEQGFAGLFIEEVHEGQLMFLTHFDKTGNQIFKTRLIKKPKIQNVGDMEIWDGYDSHKLAQIDDRFVAFISVRKRWESDFEHTVYNPNSACSGNGIHQADALITVNADGKIEYDSNVEPTASGNEGSGGFSMSSGSSGNNSSRNRVREPGLQYGNWWGASHSFTKDLLIINDHLVKMTVNDGFPHIGMALSMNDLNEDYKFESKFYDPYYENLNSRRFNRMMNCRSLKGANYVDGLMAGNIHADAEQIYASYARASDTESNPIFSKPAGGIYDANYHTKDVYFNDRNLTNTPDILETNVKSIPVGEYFLVIWNVFPENPEDGQPQDQMLFVDQNGNTISEIASIPAQFFTDESAGRNRGYFLYHSRNPVYHGSDMVKMDEYTTLWSRVLPETGDVEFITIKLPEELR